MDVNEINDEIGSFSTYPSAAENIDNIHNHNNERTDEDCLETIISSFDNDINTGFSSAFLSPNLPPQDTTANFEDLPTINTDKTYMDQGLDTTKTQQSTSSQMNPTIKHTITPESSSVNLVTQQDTSQQRGRDYLNQAMYENPMATPLRGSSIVTQQDIPQQQQQCDYWNQAMYESTIATPMRRSIASSELSPLVEDVFDEPEEFSDHQYIVGQTCPLIDGGPLASNPIRATTANATTNATDAAESTKAAQEEEIEKKMNLFSSPQQDTDFSSLYQRLIREQIATDADAACIANTSKSEQEQRDKEDEEEKLSLLLLSMPQDVEFLSFYQRLIREQVAVFKATKKDLLHTNNGPLLNQVGFQCRYCAVNKREFPRAKGSVFYPKSLHRIYIAAQKIVTLHLLPEKGCKYIPTDIREKLNSMKSTGTKSCIGGGKQYWIESAKKLGIYEHTENNENMPRLFIKNEARPKEVD